MLVLVLLNIHEMLDGHVDHILKGLVEVVADLFDLVLLVQEIFLHLVDPNIQSLDVHLRLPSSLAIVFSSPISNCCMFAPTTLSSSSMSVIFFSAPSARSLPRCASASKVPM